MGPFPPIIYQGFLLIVGQLPKHPHLKFCLKYFIMGPFPPIISGVLLNVEQLPKHPHLNFWLNVIFYDLDTML